MRLSLLSERCAADLKKIRGLADRGLVQLCLAGGQKVGERQRAVRCDRERTHRNNVGTSRRKESARFRQTTCD